jgi:hypothetical protein
MLGGNPLLDAPIDVIERGLRRVEPALARPRLFALGFLAPPAIKRILGLLLKPFLLGNVAHPYAPRYCAITITRIMAHGLSMWAVSAACYKRRISFRIAASRPGSARRSRLVTAT